MNRKKFIGSFLGLIGIATSVKELVKLVPKPILADLPGIGVTSFKVKLTKDWFSAGDILMTSNHRQYYCTGDRLVDIKNPNIVADIEWTNSSEDSFPYAKVCSVVSEGEEQARWVNINKKDILIGKIKS